MGKVYLFAYDGHDAGGGLNDLAGAYDTLPEALAALPTVSGEYAHAGTVDDQGMLVQVGEYWNTHYAIEDTFLIRGKLVEGGHNRWVRTWEEQQPAGLPSFYRLRGEVVEIGGAS